MQQNQHRLSIIDFKHTQHHTLFVQFTGYDAVLKKEFEGEVKFLRGRPFGDIIHPERTSLSSECKQFVQEKLVDKYNAGEF